MKGEIRGIGRNASVAHGICRITMTSEDDSQAEFLRALFNTWFNGWSDGDDEILESRLSAVFERRGWVKVEKISDP